MCKDNVKSLFLLHEEEIDFGTESFVDGAHPNDYGMVQ